MEVHAPEHGIHSWRDFLVHMGTICLGLLIAIGLEQTVEWAHHRSERREIEEAIRSDLKNMVAETRETQDTVDGYSRWSEATIVACRAAAAEHRTCVMTARPQAGGFSPFTDPSFRAARASGMLVLLPQEDVRALSALDDRVDIEERFFEAQETSVRRVQAFYRHFGEPGGGSTGWQHASPDDLARFVASLEIWEGDLRNMSFINREAHDSAEEMLRGRR